MTRKMPEGGVNRDERDVPLGDAPATAENGTIAAIATAPGSGGIGIVRISGDKAASIARRLFRPGRTTCQNDGLERFDPKAHHLNYGFIIDPRDGHQLDEVLVAFMPAPHSYTREDVVEIQCHGGAIVLRKILELVLLYGARPAAPGEFTRRAFMNGRIDLTQAEAVADLINARSEAALKLAVRQLGGGLKQRVGAIIDEITDILADIEADLEFGEDGVSGIAEASLDSEGVRARTIDPMQTLLNSYCYGQILRDGFRLAIAGRPNVGKSSLLNRLIDRDKAIVTPFPGTTRDPVEASITINDIAVDLVDTAGLRETQDPVECIGIQKSEEALREADVVLLVIEPQTNAEDDKIIAELAEQNILLVVNKIDLTENAAQSLSPRYRQRRPVYVSAKTGEGIALLKERICGLWSIKGGAEDEAVLCDLRHRAAMEAALVDVQSAADKIGGGESLDMIAMDFKHALQQLQLIIGEGIGDDVLAAIFQKFCIGK